MKFGSALIGAAAAVTCASQSPTFVFGGLALPVVRVGRLQLPTNASEYRDRHEVDAIAAARLMQQRPDRDCNEAGGWENCEGEAHGISRATIEDIRDAEVGRDGRRVTVGQDYGFRKSVDGPALVEGGEAAKERLGYEGSTDRSTDKESDLALERLKTRRDQTRKRRRVQVALASLGSIVGTVLLTLGVLVALRKHKERSLSVVFVGTEQL